jgi:hypothetical protein
MFSIGGPGGMSQGRTLASNRQVLNIVPVSVSEIQITIGAYEGNSIH